MEYHLCQVDEQNNKKQTKKETERKQRKKHTQHNNAQHRRNTYETSYRITDDDDDGDALNINWQHLRFLALNRLLNVFCESPTPSHRMAATSAATAAAAAELCCALLRTRVTRAGSVKRANCH